MSLDDLNEAVTRLEDLDRTGRRVLGGANPFTEGVGRELLQARAALRARETPSETPGSFQRATEEKLRTRRVVSVADRFRGLTLDGEGLPDELIWKVLSFWRTSRDGRPL